MKRDAGYGRNPKRRRRRPGRPRQRPLGPSPLFDHSCCVQDAAARSCQDHGGASDPTLPRTKSTLTVFESLVQATERCEEEGMTLLFIS